jgi:Ca2+-binding EF-hand superfamily protein
VDRRRELRKVYRAFDSNADGTLSVTEFLSVFEFRVEVPFQRHFNVISTPFRDHFQRHVDAISTPFPRHFNAG